MQKILYIHVNLFINILWANNISLHNYVVVFFVFYNFFIIILIFLGAVMRTKKQSDRTRAAASKKLMQEARGEEAALQVAVQVVAQATTNQGHWGGPLPRRRTLHTYHSRYVRAVKVPFLLR
jgi:hypothetical protein